MLARCSRRILARDIPREQFMKMLETGKTDLLDKFWSQRTRRPFNAFLVLKPDNTTGFEFAPARPRTPTPPRAGQAQGGRPQGRRRGHPADSRARQLGAAAPFPGPPASGTGSRSPSARRGIAGPAARYLLPGEQPRVSPRTYCGLRRGFLRSFFPP